jgi:tetratricopeptide (TPR) repeat protein
VTRSQVSRDPDGHANRGVSYARNKQYDKAIDEFTKAIEAQQKNPPNNYRNRAQAYELIKQPEKAIADYGKVIELTPNDANAYAGRGRLEAQTKKYDAAIKNLTRALELNPRDMESRRYRAYAFLSRQQWRQAAADYDAIIKAAPQGRGGAGETGLRL